MWVHDKRLYIEHEAYGIGVDIVSTPALFDRVPDSRRYVIRADCARPETISHVANAGFRCEAALKWPGSVEDGISFLRSYEQIVIHPRCKHAAEEFRLYSYKIDRLTSDILPDLKPGWDHVVDSVRYALQPMIRQESVPIYEPTEGLYRSRR
jgi:phage terminase large subunit